MAKNPHTKLTRRTNKDIYDKELKKLGRLQSKAAKYGIQDSYKPTKAKRIRQEHIKGIQAYGTSLRKEIKKAQTRERNERRRQQRHDEAVVGDSGLPYNEADRLPGTDILPFGVLAEQRFMHYIQELDKAISLLERSRRYDETALMEFRDLLTDWYQEDPAEVTQKLLQSLESDGISDYNYFYNLVETGQIATVIYKAQLEHERFKNIYISEQFGILEDED